VTFNSSGKANNNFVTWLRGLIIALLGLAIIAPSLPLRPAQTIFILDQSPSAREALWKIAPQIALSGAKYLAFASDASEVASATARRLDLGEGTNLVQSLRKAQSLHPDQMVLVSDGLFQSEAVPPVPTYGLYIPPSPNLSLSLIPPALPNRGEIVEVRVLIESTTQTKARLVLSGPAGQLKREIRVEPGRSSYGYRFRLDQPEVVKARIESPLGIQEARVEVSPGDSTRVWVIGDPAAAVYLKSQGFAVETKKNVDVPIRAKVVVLGVGARDLSAAELDALASFLDQGGSLLWTATPRGLFFGGWERSTLADAIPIEPLEEPGGVGLVLVLDVSGSMANAQKLELAIAGASELVRSARPQDYIGVVVFSFRDRWLFRPRPMTAQGRREAEALLQSLQAGGGTRISGAYLSALEEVAKLPSQSKQILVLTDGLVEDAQQPLWDAAKLAGSKIKTNAVALGADADQAFLKRLASEGQGTFWNVPSPQDLPRFFLEEAQRAFKRKALEGTFPLSVRPHPITQGFDPPPLRVIMPARAKPWAGGLLYSGNQVVLAVGESGRGRVAALSTDLSRSWVGWNQAPALLAELLRWLSQTPARPRVQAIRDGSVRVVLEGQFERPGLRYSGQEQPFAPVAPLRYEAQLPQSATGEAVVLEGAEPRLQIKLPEAAEWRLEDGKENLKRLSQGSGGRLLNGPDELKSLGKHYPLNLRPYLLGLALLLFLAERYLERRLVRSSLTLV